jgi:prevent-host-death family protein
MAAGEFKAKCLGVLDEVARTGLSVVVTKRGKPVAEVVPIREAAPLEGSILREGDVVSPLEEPWNSNG